MTSTLGNAETRSYDVRLRDVLIGLYTLEVAANEHEIAALRTQSGNAEKYAARSAAIDAVAQMVRRVMRGDQTVRQVLLVLDTILGHKTPATTTGQEMHSAYTVARNVLATYFPELGGD